jgi:hypothetical protein
MAVVTRWECACLNQTNHNVTEGKGGGGTLSRGRLLVPHLLELRVRAMLMNILNQIQTFQLRIILHEMSTGAEQRNSASRMCI